MEALHGYHPAEGQMRTRSMWRISLLGIVLSSSAVAEPLTENRVVEMGLEQPHFNQLLESRENAARGNSLAIQTWENPEIELSHEKLGDETEISVILHQQFDISGHRKLNTQASEHELFAVEASNRAARIERKIQLLGHFYQLLFQQRQRQHLSQWVEKFSTVEAAMHKREEAGDVSGYDRRRISRERITLTAEQRSIDAEYQAARERLSGMLGHEDASLIIDVDGELAPDTQPPLEPLLQGLENHPALAKLRLLSQAAKLSSQATGRTHIPPLTLGIGLQNVDGPSGDDSGLMLSASVPLALFDRKQGQRQRFSAEAIHAESEYQLAIRQSSANLRALWRKADQLNENSRLFREQSVAASYELVGIAEAAYNANEIGVLELVDAYRSALDAETQALELALQARMARLELNKMMEGIQR